MLDTSALPDEDCQSWNGNVAKKTLPSYCEKSKNTTLIPSFGAVNMTLKDHMAPFISWLTSWLAERSNMEVTSCDQT